MNKTIGKRYRLIEVVGEGGMNTVYKAEDLRSGELVAIKILNGEFNDDEDVVKRFHLESEAIQKLNHDHIVKVFDIGEEDGQNYIVMELLKSHTLKDIITQNERYFNNEDIIDMSLQILYGIKNAHDNKIVHRDIKPQNILLDEEGRLKVSDFGIARVVNSDTMHNMRDAIGSVHYASPEQSRGSFVDERSDIYSFGIVLYELSTGRLPFDGDSAISIAIKHTKNKMVDPSHLNLNLNPSIGNIIKKCIQKEPSQRFQTVEEIIGLFEELRLHPEEELGKQFNSFFAVSTETIDMRSIAPYLNLEDEMERKVLSTKDKAKVNMVPMLITISSAIVIGVLVLFLIFLKTNRKVESMRPFELDDLSGMSYVEASDLLASKRLFIEQKEAVHDDTVKANHIISQSPAPKSIVQEGKTIKVVVSLGKKENKAPNLVGKSIQEAKVMLNNEEIDFEVDEEFSKEKMGTIVKQWPKAGTKLSSKDKMNLIISMGEEPKMHVMPSLKGMHLNSATSTLAELNIIVGTTEYQFDDVIEKDYVIWQSISPNMSVEENTVVNLKVSKGKDTAQKPESEGEGTPSGQSDPSSPSKADEGAENGTNGGSDPGSGSGSGAGSKPPAEPEPAPSIPEELQ